MPFKVVPKYYYVWASMKDRCYNQNNIQFKDYGGRGIVVCDRWRSDYRTFEADMGDRPHGYSIDRIDNEGNYDPSNCRWASRKQQQRNQRRAVYVTVEGIRYRAIELAEASGHKTEIIMERAARGLSYESVTSREKLYSQDTSAAVAGKKRAAAQKTHCKEGHELTVSNTYTTKQGWRLCRQCHNAKMRRLKASS
ncbi:hypothetical protein [Rhizobium sp. NZLR11]|uniref:hypothetical protein n=1 Tax=Rhizobium sp. NZLR11 TaxID=2731098 RepID=UPI001C83392E|nr:hypothetical protein [Rhizobium sp. NZLR11]MBX5206683.1 hypothetical protein [Rhizobium sp. NZLR11]